MRTLSLNINHHSSIPTKLFILGTVAISTCASVIHWGQYYGYSIQFPYAVIFAWAIYRPDQTRIFPLLIMGILKDALIGGQLGLTSGAFWLVWWLAIGQRWFLIKRHFSLAWMSFFGVASLAEALRLLMITLTSSQRPLISIIAYDLLMLSAFFPLVARLIYWLSKKYRP
jgi:rod shape-determining protein MreD